MDLDESADLSDIRWHDKSADSVLSPHPSSNLSLPLSQPLRSERSGRDTPASVDSIPLEWDHDYDLSRDLETAVSRALHSEEDGGQEKDFYLRGAAGIAGMVAGCVLCFLQVKKKANVTCVIAWPRFSWKSTLNSP